MELDDLRRRWQEQPAGPSEPSLTQKKLQAMLASQTDTPLSQMLRNARKEQRMLLFVLVLNLANVANLMNRYLSDTVFLAQLLLYICVGLMVVFMAWTTYRQRRLLTQLQAGDASTYTHLRQSIHQIRILMTTKMNAGMLFLASIILVGFYIRYDTIVQALHQGTIDWPLTILVILAIVMLITGLLYVDQRMQQRRYGQYLDQLETTLRELEE
ncbi:ABC transporter permease [Hymenobacter sp. DG25A]|uniref:ABC transporter permease n=1 Tax=Hymenobacter sp. DG25A TaxID=1385663 RepID=UPI0006BC3EB3|nr:ABC transporter permease [Hymenobacter sp. DG25A]ALD21541.1 hypothetical protein AM218_10385 [Hymenobacter sp. DG25A]